jgi:hypothetical protein
MFRNYQQRMGARLGLAAFALILLAVVSQSAQAQLSFGAFTLKITEKEMNLVHPNDIDWQNYFNKDLPFQRMNDRNMPYLELTNDADSEAPITEFHLTIGDERFNFANKNLGMYAMLGSSTKNFQIESSTVNNAGNELVVKILGDGLAPGELIRFKIDLDVDAAFAGQFFAHPDYRTVLFDMNGMNVYDGFLEDVNTADNAKASAIFDPASGPNFTIGPVALADSTVTGAAADFYNNNYRKLRDRDPVRTYSVVGEGDGVIPEPGSIVLFLAGMVGGIATLRRRRVR